MERAAAIGNRCRTLTATPVDVTHFANQSAKELGEHSASEA
jgi:hypothetical protein